MINLAELIVDPDFAQKFNVYRSTGSFIKGVWTEGTTTVIEMVGVVTVMSSKDLRQIPEGDRITGAMTFYAQGELFVTRDGQYLGTSDKIYWRGNYYKLFSVSPWVDYGFYSAHGDRILGA